MDIKSGYFKKRLHVDLTEGRAQRLPISDEIIERFVGGRGFGAKVVWYHLVKHDFQIDPLGPENLLAIAPGPLTGTYCPSSGKTSLVSISPQTGVYGDSSVGGTFGIELRQTGVDMLTLLGRAPQLSILFLDEEEVQILPAPELAGKTCLEAEGMVKDRLGTHEVKVAAIGPAGEGLVRFACVNADWSRNSGRAGMGAVLGSKNVKAIAVRGSKDLPVHNVRGLVEEAEKAYAYMRNHKYFRMWQREGLMMVMEYASAAGILPTHNFKDGTFPRVDRINGETMLGGYKIGDSACFACSMSCGNLCLVKQGRYVGTVTEGPEYESCAMLGSNLGVDNYAAVLRSCSICDELGMDTISTAGSVAFAMELNEKGLWDNGLKFGEVDNLSQVFEDIAYRRGIGDILAQGTKRMAERFGGKEFAINAKGMELAAYEPRSAVGHGLGYATANRGGCHLNAGYVVVLEGLGLNINQYTPHGKAAIAIFFQNMMECVSAMGSCLFTTYAVLPAPVMARPDWIVTKITNKAFTKIGPIIGLLDMHPWIASMNLPLIMHGPALRDATGMKVNIGMMMKTGERGYNLERQCNIILGQKAGADTLPKRLTDEPQYPENPKSKVPLQKMLKNYYFIRGWKDGVPTKRKLDKLGIH